MYKMVLGYLGLNDDRKKFFSLSHPTKQRFIFFCSQFLTLKRKTLSPNMCAPYAYSWLHNSQLENSFSHVCMYEDISHLVWYKANAQVMALRLYVFYTWNDSRCRHYRLLHCAPHEICIAAAASFRVIPPLFLTVTKCSQTNNYDQNILDSSLSWANIYI